MRDNFFGMGIGCISIILSGCSLGQIRPSRGLDVMPPAELAAMGFSGCHDLQTQNLSGHNFAALGDVDLLGHLRIVYPGQLLPDDTDPDRLNAEVNGDGVILRLFCG